MISQKRKMEINKKTTKKIEEVVKNLLSKMNVKAVCRSEISDIDNNSQILAINIQTDNPNILIGQNGLNLRALQHIARTIVRKKLEKPVNFIVDVNGYKKNKEVYLKELAHGVAEKVLQSNKLIVLKPMTAYERRIVHLELAKNDLVETESLGEEPERRIVVKPKKKD